MQKHLIFLHGWKGSFTSWENNISSFEERGFNCTAVKFPGFDLPNPPSNWGVPEYAEYVKGLIKEPCIIVGHSFGGRVAIYLASKHPNLVEKLILTDAAGVNIEPLFLRKALLFLSKSMKDLEQKLGKAATLIALPRNIVRSVIGSKGYKEAGPIMKEVFKNVVNLDLRDCLTKIECPTLIVWGEKDRVTPIKMAEYFNTHIPNSQLRVIKGAKHSPHKTHTEEWNNAVLKFLETL